MKWSKSYLPVLLMAAFLPHPASAQGAPFTCNDDLYQVRSETGAGGTGALLRFPQAVLIGGGTATNVWGALRTPGTNSMGFRRQDGYLYGLLQSTQLPQLYRMGQTGPVLVGTIVTQGAQSPVLNASFVPTGGTFDDQGRYYFAGQNGNIVPSAIYRVDNFTTDVDPGTPGVQLGVAAIYPLSTTLINIGDFGFGPDGNLYGATGTTLAQIHLPASPGTAIVTTRSISTVGGIGSAFFSNAGDLYVYDNGNSALSRVVFEFGTAFATGAVSVGPVVTINGAPPLPATIAATDGASCVLPTTDMSVAVNLPSVLAPGSTVYGTLVCTNNGPSAAATVTCSASTSTPGATLTIGTCTPPAPDAALRATAGLNTITCPITLIVPGTLGGTDTTQTQVSVTGNTTTVTPDNNSANNTSTVTPAIIDALDDTDTKPAGAVGATSNVATNDQYPPNSVFSRTGGTCTAASMSTAGVATYTVPGNGNCTVLYQVCAPAPNATVCDTATLTVTAAPNADLSITKTNTPASGPVDQAADTVTSGSISTYDIVVSNAGPSTAANAVLRDPPPTNFNGCALVAGQECAVTSGTATCPAVGAGAGQLSIANLQSAGGVLVPSMAAGSSITVRLRCTVP